LIVQRRRVGIVEALTFSGARCQRRRAPDVAGTAYQNKQSVIGDQFKIAHWSVDWLSKIEQDDKWSFRRRPQSDHNVEDVVRGRGSGVFGPGSSNGAAQPAVAVKSLHVKIGELTLENDFLEGALSKAGLLSAKR
jgi:hypothetical protein